MLGLMSGTSVDAIDAVLVRLADRHIELIDCLALPLPDELRAAIAAISQSGPNEIERLGILDRQLGLSFAEAALALLSQAGIERDKVRAIGSHGQTIRHRPPSSRAAGEVAFTLQIGDPNTIAEVTGITTVADFRRRDIAAGGEGAPLAPAFHAAVFADHSEHRAIVNIGGIANVTLLAGAAVSGFDSGPGNTLLDHWVQRHRGQRYDVDGAWAAAGTVNERLLHNMLAHPFLAQAPPKSTGKEMFNLAWLQQQLTALAPVDAGDVQATLAEFTACAIAAAITGAGVNVGDTAAATTMDDVAIGAVYVCGGGAANADLMRRLRHKLAPVKLGTSTELGCDPAWVEAAAFAWLAQRTLNGMSGNLPAVTGADGERVLGTVFPAQT